MYEQFDEAPMAITAPRRYVMNVRGSREVLQRLCNGWVETPDRREPLREELLECIETALQRARRGQTIAHRHDTYAPEIFERSVPLRELASVNAEQDLRGPGTKLGADGAERLRHITDIKSRARSSHDRGADQMTIEIPVVVEQTQRVVG